MSKLKIEHKDINLARIAFAAGQYFDDDLSCKDTEDLIATAESFTEWEKKNVLSLPNGWDDYTDNGGDDYESEIYKWAKEYVDER